MLATSIVFVTILFLVDKNGQWKNFWRVVGALTILAVLGMAGIYANEKAEARKQMTPDTFMATHQTAPTGDPYAEFGGHAEQYSDLPKGANVLMPRPDFSKNPPRVPSPQNPIR